MKTNLLFFIASLLVFVSCKPGSTNSNESQKDSTGINALMTTELNSVATTESTDQDSSVTLPPTAVLAAQTKNHELYTYVMREANENETANVVSVFLKDKKSGKVKCVLVSNPMADLRWDDMRDRHAVDVTLDQIAAADNVVFVPWDENKILVEGCPDARNVWTYVIDTEHMTAMQFPAKEGLTRFDEAKHHILMSDYRYHDEGGRYSVEETYTEDGAFVEERMLGDL